MSYKSNSNHSTCASFPRRIIAFTLTFLMMLNLAIPQALAQYKEDGLTTSSDKEPRQADENKEQIKSDESSSQLNKESTNKPNTGEGLYSEAQLRSIEAARQKSYPKLNSLLGNPASDSANDARPSSSMDGMELLQSNPQSYGNKSGLKELDSVRIERPKYTNSSPQGKHPPHDPVTGMPPTAPDIVKHAKPLVAPGAPDKNIKTIAPAKKVEDKATRIERPNQSQVVTEGTEVASPTSKIEEKNAKAYSTNSQEVKPLKPETKENTVQTVPGLKPQTPQLAKPEKAETGQDLASDDTKTNGTTPTSVSDIVEKYPVVGRLENLTFGTSRPQLGVDERLGKLEHSIFARVFAEDSLFDRTERLKRTLLGVEAYDDAMAPNLSPTAVETLDPPLTGSGASEQDFYYLDDMAKMPDNLQEESATILNAFANELINFERKKRSLAPLEHDDLIQKMANRQMQSMIEVKQLSHSDLDGQNPDRRFTKLGGVDAVTEGLVATSTADLASSKLSKAAVCILLKKMFLRQDDREALLAPEATHLATAFGRIYNGTKIFACTEVLTRRGKIDLIGIEARPGDKVDISGSVERPYKFDRITIAWEEIFDSPMEENPDSDEALPYFPPLDYVAYSKKSEKDYSKAITALKALGVVAAIAGGVFVPPVALAAPLIVMAGPGGSEMKPQSDIPVKGGVKIHGSSFKAHIPLDNESQEGLYYVTVWASLGDGTRAFPVSRRAILVTKDDNDKKDSYKENSAPIEYTNESNENSDTGLEQSSPEKKQDLDNDKDESKDNKPGI